MAQIVNQYSFVVSTVFLLAVLGAVLLRSPQRKRAFAVLGVVALAVLGSWFAIRPQASAVGSASDALALIGSGTPVLLEFQSPY